MTVSHIIRETIRNEGPIAFDRFMEMALYYPELGYYNKLRNPIGTTGDFYTMPHLTPVLGAMIARQLQEMWEILGQPETFTVIEVGAGNGQLCRSILRHAETKNDFAIALQYGIVECSPAMCVRAKAIVPQFVEFYPCLETLPQFNGCILSNELFDNIPFSILVQKKELMEVFVDYDLDFFEILQPLSRMVKDSMDAAPSHLPYNGRIEVSRRSAEYITQFAAKLQKGFMLTIDYGFLESALQEKYNTAGTITCYRKHETHHNPYIHVGDQDITCHVNFTNLNQFGSSNGFDLAGYVCQANFLRSLGLMSYLMENRGTDPGQLKAVRYVSDLLLGNQNAFKVMAHSKGLPAPRLTGLHLREPMKV